MSDPRGPVEVFVKKVPKEKGSFLTKIKVELFPARYWSRRFRWNPSQRRKCAFYYCDIDMWWRLRTTPSTEESMDKYYRLRVDGKFYQQDDKQYCFYTKEKVWELLKESDDERG